MLFFISPPAAELWEYANTFYCSHHRGKVLKAAAHYYFILLKSITYDKLRTYKEVLKTEKPNVALHLAKVEDSRQYLSALPQEAQEEGTRSQTTQSNTESMNNRIHQARCDIKI